MNRTAEENAQTTAAAAADVHGLWQQAALDTTELSEAIARIIADEEAMQLRERSVAAD